MSLFPKSYIIFFVLTSLLVFRANSKVKRVKPNETLYGVEYTAQDQTMILEPGRKTLETDHKAKKVEALVDVFYEIYGDQVNKVIEGNGRMQNDGVTPRPGKTFVLINGEKHIIVPEPVTVEYSAPPRLKHEVERDAYFFFKAIGEASLLPYVQPGAERSGMGHIHVGGKTIGQSPFYKNPHLLRNMEVFFHKNPALLYGFAEVYDLGRKSNIENYHHVVRQKQFQKAVLEFDQWWIGAEERERKKGLFRYLSFLKANDNGQDYGKEKGWDFFAHYRVLNKENFLVDGKIIDFTGEEKGQLTLEFRPFRPFKSSEHLMAIIDLVEAVMEHLSDPEHLEAFAFFTVEEHERFMTSAKIRSNWNQVKKILGLKSHRVHLLDEMINETAMVFEGAPFRSFTVEDLEIYKALSPQRTKGRAFELRFPVESSSNLPIMYYRGHRLSFELIKLEEKKYWVSYIDTAELGGDLLDIQKNVSLAPDHVLSQTGRALSCKTILF